MFLTACRCAEHSYIATAILSEHLATSRVACLLMKIQFGNYDCVFSVNDDVDINIIITVTTSAEELIFASVSVCEQDRLSYDIPLA